MRKLHEIAGDALADPTLKGSAREFAGPYLRALLFCERASDPYFFEDAGTQVMYALSNLQSWRGERARRVKAELNEHLKSRS